jgi:hypothetical protein
MPTTRVGLAIVLALSLAGCVDAERLNIACEWSDSRTGPLALQSAADRRHLRQDAQVAEGLGLRRGDSFRGVKSIPERRAMVIACTDSLFNLIVSTHGVSGDVARAAALERNLLIDLVLVLLPLVALLWGAAVFATGRVRKRFLPDEPRIAVVATLVAAAFVVGLWWFAGEMWSWVVEMMRLRDGHISYRAERLPWYRFGVPLFVLGLAIFGSVAWREWPVTRHGARSATS